MKEMVRTRKTIKRSATPKVESGTQSKIFKRWFRKYPVLRQALKESKKRFQNFPGVSGFGIGKKLKQQTGKHGPTYKSTDGLCIRINVHQKIPRSKLTRSQRIPSSILVKIPNQKKRTKVFLDIVATGIAQQDNLIMRAESTKGKWPTAERITPGAWFSFGRFEATASQGNFIDGTNVEIGTVGSLLRTSNGSFFATSAGHVFTRPCQNELDAPNSPRPIGTRGHAWTRVSDSNFFPSRIADGQFIHDAMVFKVPKPLMDVGATILPTAFKGRLATESDKDSAVKLKGVSGFILVERGRERVKYPIDLLAAEEFFSEEVACNGLTKKLDYGFVWAYQFDEQTTQGGDSGAPVFITAIDSNKEEFRLLGFHFLRAGNLAWAVDAENFFLQVVGSPGEDFQLLHGD